jgi:hypothetical protein
VTCLPALWLLIVGTMVNEFQEEKPRLSLEGILPLGDGHEAEKSFAGTSATGENIERLTNDDSILSEYVLFEWTHPERDRFR